MRMPPNKSKEIQEPVVVPEDAMGFLDGRKEEDTKRQISMKISIDLLTRCDEAARRVYMTRSAYIKTALREKLERDRKA